MEKSNRNLQKSKQNKNDEFYTIYKDIEKELTYYKKHFKNKIVYCNCDNYTTSNFWNYFITNFQILEIKKLMCTSYHKDQAYKYSYDGIIVKKEKLISNGDFRSLECLLLLKESDIVVTNPPFSLFREYLPLLIQYHKDFLIVGNVNAFTYREIFPLIKEYKIWTGYSHIKEFIQPNGEIKKFGNILWFTNLDIEKKYEKLLLTKKYSVIDNPKYDNYDAIEINKISNIPYDYVEVMGVPITIIEKLNKEQFEIIGTDEAEGTGLSNGLFISGRQKQCCIKGKKIYKRIFIKRK